MRRLGGRLAWGAGLLALAVAAAGAPAQAQSGGLPPWLQGVWGGRGYQANGSNWTIRLTVEGGRFQIDYPSLNCGGSWTLASRSGASLLFVESIAYGRERCVTSGSVRIDPVSPQALGYVYDGSEAAHHATATLIRAQPGS